MQRRTEAPSVVVLDDDHFAREDISIELKRAVPRVQVQEVETEYRFRQRLPSFRETPPDVFILDMRVRWTDPSPDMVPAPADVRQGGFEEAGYRCQRLIAEDPQTAQVPIIIWTILEDDEVDRTKLVGLNTRVVTKSEDFEPLIHGIKRLLS